MTVAVAPGAAPPASPRGLLSSFLLGGPLSPPLSLSPPLLLPSLSPPLSSLRPLPFPPSLLPLCLCFCFCTLVFTTSKGLSIRLEIAACTSPPLFCSSNHAWSADAPVNSATCWIFLLSELDTPFRCPTATLVFMFTARLLLLFCSDDPPLPFLLPSVLFATGSSSPIQQVALSLSLTLVLCDGDTDRETNKKKNRSVSLSRVRSGKRVGGRGGRAPRRLVLAGDRGRRVPLARSPTRKENLASPFPDDRPRARTHLAFSFSTGTHLWLAARSPASPALAAITQFPKLAKSIENEPLPPSPKKSNAL